MDHFARLGVPAALDLEPAALDKAYFALQRQWHPDRFVAKPAEERARASAEAAALNDAYRTLKDPLSRAIYLAGMKGVQLPGDGKTIDDPELLMEVMDAREELQDATSVGEVDALAKFAREDLQKALADLPKLFSAGDTQAIRTALLRMRYLDKFADEAKSRRANIGRAG
jgi:molecular chaperone HscB